MARFRLAFRAIAMLGATAAVAYLAVLRMRVLEPVPGALAVLMGIAATGLAGMLLGSLVALREGGPRAPRLGEAGLAVGLLAIAGGGAANWVFGMQGFVVLEERAPLRLSRTSEIMAFTHGPLADFRELDLTIALARLELAPAGREAFRPVSRLRVLDAAGEERGVDVSRASPGRFRNLVFRQGAFGFAPRVVVTRGGRAVLDAHVPFRTLREGNDGVSFLGEFEIASEQLAFEGAVTLENLNEEMKGHPRLELAARQGDRRLGTGNLAPGEVAEIGEGYSVAFAGLKRWSEIDFSRRRYPAPMLGGAILALLSAAVWIVAALRRG